MLAKCEDSSATDLSNLSGRVDDSAGHTAGGSKDGGARTNRKARFETLCRNLRRPTGICAPGRWWGYGWPCWVAI